MAMTSAEKTRVYRQRMKEKGGKEFSIRLSPEDVQMIEIIGKHKYPGLRVEEIARAMLSSDCTRLRKIVHEKIRLRDEFEADSELIETYVLFEVLKGEVMAAEDFLNSCDAAKVTQQ